MRPARTRRRAQRRFAWLSLILLVSAGIYAFVNGAQTYGRDYYVSPTGNPMAKGSLDDPWDLQTALAHPRVVQPGDTIWLRGGAYKGLFVSDLRGRVDDPIVVRQYPGERATIDSGTDASAAAMLIRGSDTWYWGFEVMSSSPSRFTPNPGPEARGLERASGFQVMGPRTKFINLTVHDTAGAFGFWSAAADSEIYGCLMYYNGWSAPDRGHGEGIYAQNQNGRKRIRNNIHFASFGQGIRAYGTEHAFVNNIEFSRNVSFNTGVMNGNHVGNFQVTVGRGSQGILFEENHSYHPPSTAEGSSTLGWVFSGVENDVVARKNIWVGGVAAVEVWNWNRVVFEENTMYSDAGLMALMSHTPQQDHAGYAWDRNTYYGSGVLRLLSGNLRWQPWLDASGLDRNSRFSPGRPRNNWIFLYTNEFDPARAHLIVYNWEGRTQVPVDLSSVVPVASEFQVLDAQNYFGDPVAKGRYQGGTVSIPVNSERMSVAAGTATPAHTSPEFGVFIVISKKSVER